MSIGVHHGGLDPLRKGAGTLLATVAQFTWDIAKPLQKQRPTLQTYVNAYTQYEIKAVQVAHRP